MVIYSAGLRVSEAAALKVHHIVSRPCVCLLPVARAARPATRCCPRPVSSICGRTGASTALSIPKGGCFSVRTRSLTSHPEASNRHSTKHASGQALPSRFRFTPFAMPLPLTCWKTAQPGATLLQVKELLGHASIQTTTIYLHLANLTAGLKSPLDNWPVVSQTEGDTRG